VGLWDVYVDDFIGMVQGGATRQRRLKRALMYSLDKVFYGLGSTIRPYRQEPASIKKLGLDRVERLLTRAGMLEW
jgi:hypothetical protein